MIVDVDDLIALRPEPRPYVGAPKVDQGDLLQPETQEVVLQARTELFGPLRQLHGNPTMVWVAADLGGDHNPAAGRERFADGAVHGAVAIELGCVDMVDAEVDRTSQHGDRLVMVHRAKL